MVGTSSGYLEGLPQAVQRRIKALKNNQVEIVKVDTEFHQQVCALQASFEKRYQEVYEKVRRRGGEEGRGDEMGGGGIGFLEETCYIVVMCLVMTMTCHITFGDIRLHVTHV